MTIHTEPTKMVKYHAWYSKQQEEFYKSHDFDYLRYWSSPLNDNTTEAYKLFCAQEQHKLFCAQERQKLIEQKLPLTLSEEEIEQELVTRWKNPLKYTNVVFKDVHGNNVLCTQVTSLDICANYYQTLHLENFTDVEYLGVVVELVCGIGNK